MLEYRNINIRFKISISRQLLILSLLVGGYNFYKTFSYLELPQIDLRNRVVGARLMQATGKDPYFYKWTPEDSIYFLIPHEEAHLIVNTCTVTPSILFIYTLFAGGYYLYICYFWWFFQHACLFFIFIYFYVKSARLEKNILLVVYLLVVYALPAWHLHLAVGQMYIFYALLLTVFYHFYSQTGLNNQALAGVVLGLLIWLRPTFLFFALVLFLYKRWQLILSTAMVGSLFLVFTLAIGHFSYWQSYSQAMEEYAKEQLGTMTVKQPAHSLTSKDLQTISLNVEGTNFNRWDFLDWLKIDVLSVQLFAARILKIHLHKEVLLLIYFTSFLLLLALLNLKKATPTDLFYLAFLSLMLIEYCLPAARGNYNFVQWIPVLFLYLHRFELGYLQRFSFQLLCLGILFLLGFTSWFPDSTSLGEVLLFISFVLFIKEQKQFSANL